MKPIIERILRDHGHYRRLLDLLERHLDSTASGVRPDYELMGDIMHYMAHYPDMFHHPFEDKLFMVLVDIDRSAQPLVDDLLAQHQHIAAVGKKLLDDLGAVVHERLIPWAAMEAEARRYIDSLRAHLHTEESELIPRAEQALAARPAHELPDPEALGTDPLFGGVVEQRYADLYRFIVGDVDEGASAG